MTSSHDGTTRRWDIATGKEITNTRKGHTALVRAITFSPDGNQALSGSDDGTARLWDIKTVKTLAVLKGHKGSVHLVRFSPDGKRALTGGNDGFVCVWDLANKKVLHTFQEANLQKAVFSSDGATLITGGWKISRARGIKPLAFHVWDIESETVKHTIAYPKNLYAPNALSISPNGKLLCIVFREKNPEIWDLESGRKRHELQVPIPPGHTRSTYMANFSPNGKHVLTGNYGSPSSAPVCLWSTETGKLIAHRMKIDDSGFAPNSRNGLLTQDGQIALFETYGRLYLWDTKQDKQIKIFSSNGSIGIQSYSLDEKGKRILITGDDGSIRLWDLEKRQSTKVFRHSNPQTKTCEAVFSADGKKILSTNGAETLVWDATVSREGANQGKKD